MAARQSSTSAGATTRVVVVDDSRVMRALIGAALIEDGDIDVVGSAADPFEAREMIRAASPDVVTLDVEMPRMGGLEFLRRIMALRPMPVIMVSTTTTAGADNTLTALEIGAIDFVAKPANQADWSSFGQSLRDKVRAAAKVKLSPGAVASYHKPAVAPGGAKTGMAVRGRLKPGARLNCSLIAVGASTGGVTAINRLLAALPEIIPPLVIAQHMPPGFTARFADRLARATGRDVAQASDGDGLQPGTVRLAPGDLHLRVARLEGRLICKTSDDAPVSNYRPSVDELFASVATACGKRAIGVILTGMGRDGAKGLLQMRGAGARTFGEAEVSCTVYGMPKAAMQIGAVGDEYPIDELAAQLGGLVGTAPGGDKSCND